MAGALSKREIEMIFRADTDKAIRPVGELGKAVKGLTADLREQDKAADKGQASLESLAGTTRELKAAQDELGTARSLLTQLNAQEAALAKAEARAEETRQKYQQLSEQVAAAEKPTKRLTNSMEAAERAQKAAAERLSEVASETAEVRQRIEAIIGPVANFQQSFKQIADTSRDISQGLAVAGKAADDFRAKMAAASAVDAKLDSDVSFEQAGRSAGLLQAQIDYISQFENRVELLAAAKRELVAGDAAFQKAVSVQEAKVGADNVARLEANIRSAFEEADRLKSVAGFRDIAAQSVAAANDTARYGTAAQSAIQPVTRLRDAVIGLTNPAQAAANTLEAVANGIEAAEVALNSKSKLATALYQEALNEVSRSVAGLERQAAQVDGLRTQQAAVDAAQQSFDVARQKVLDLANALATADEPTNEMAQALRNAETAAEAAGNALGREKGKLDTLAAGAKKAGIDIRNLDEAEKKLIATSGRAAKAAEGLNGKLGRNGGGFLGLKPNELQNLSYQINDIFTSLASGIPIQQVIAQQSGQIAQIPGLLAAIAPYAVPLLAVAAAITAISIALTHAADEAERMRQFEGTLSAMGAGVANGLDAAKLEQSTKTLRDYGVAVEDAQKVVTTFAKEGIDPAIFDDFTAGAANAAKVMGIEVTDAAEKMAKGFTGGKKEVLALADEFPFLSDAERTQIRAMDDSTQQNEIRRIAFDAFYRKMAQGAQDMEGPWSNATRTLGSAWNGMLDTLAATGIVDSIIGTISNAVRGLAVLINLAKGYNAALSNAAPRNLKEFVFGSGREVNFSDVYSGALAKTQQQMAAADPTRRARTGGGRDPGAGTRGQRRETEQRQDADAKQAAKDAKKAARDAEAARKRALAEAKRLADEIRNQSEQLDNSIDRMTTTALRRQTGSVTEQLANAAKSVEKEFAPLQRELDEFAAKTGGNGMIGGRTIAQYQAVLNANKEILTQTRQMGVYEGTVNDIVAERDRLLKGIQEKVAAGDLTPGQGIAETLEVTSRLNPLLTKAADDAIAFAKAINSASPSPELAALIAKLETARAGSGTGNNDRAGRDQANAFLKVGEEQINTVVERRNALLQANAMLVELGVRTTKEGQAVQAQAYALTNVELNKMLALQRAALEANRSLLAPGVYEAKVAELDAIATKAIYVNDNVRQMNQLVNGELMAGGSALFSSMAQGIAGVLTGTQSLGDAFDGVLNTFLNFAAQFLQKIAEMIIQTLILQAIQSALGVPPGGGGGGLGALFFHSGTDSVGGYGNGARRRSSMSNIDPAVLSAVPRYHEGTQGVGLKRDEQLAVLQTGEKVLTEEQQRREAASNAGGGGDLGLRQVLAFGDDEIAGAMSGPAGEKTVVSHIRRNKTMIKQLLKD